MRRRSGIARLARVLGLAALALALFLCGRPAHAQVFELNGGSSSLYDAAGGSFSVHAPGYDATFGAGMVNGHFSYGAKVEKQIGPNLLTIGDDQINMLLPTDIFDPSHYLFGRGLGLKTKRDGMDILVFGGTTSTLYQTPVFEGAGSDSPMGFVALHKTASPQWQFWSESLFSDKMTQIFAAQWTPVRKFALAGSAGVGANQPYAAASMNLSRKYIDVLGSYVSAGPEFRRAVVSSPIQAEPDKGNLLVTLKPVRFLTFNGGTQNFLVPNLETKANESSSVLDASAIMQVAGAQLSGTVYDSTALGQSNHAVAITASRGATRWFKVTSNYMVSKPSEAKGTSSFFTTVTEILNQRVSVNENISTSNGQTSLLYGGSLLTNLLTVSANYENFYVPVNTGSPFQQSLMLDVSLHLFGRVNLHGATFVGPTGKTLYTATANTIAVRGQSVLNGNQPTSVGNSLLRVQVVDPENRPIEGAALLVDAKPVFTDADGTFALRERKPHVHSLKVLTDQFLEGGSWEVQSIPAEIWSSAREGDPGAVIVVRRIPITASVVRSEASHSDMGNEK